ncbi:MAG: protein kinase [Phycisphaerales bacterium]|nr:protein kinase [Phycisphaerales bacterium]
MDRELARVRALFDEVLQASPEDRPALLAARCGSDSVLKRRIEALVATAESEDPFLSQPTRSTQLTSALPSPPLFERPGSRIGPYKLLQQIGEGGFGVVFMAEQDQPVRRRVALKIIKFGMDTRQIVARFEQERQALALMDHPNIAKVLDAGATESGRPYFVMEYVKGDPITDFADAHRLSVPDRLRLFAQVCAAVQHAHTKGVVHRDLKPRNVLVNMTDGKPFAKIIDFGIAKATGARLTEKTLFTEHRQLIGTPEYMSPEQAEGSPDIDTRTDVYSLGVLLYELLTGATPFDAERLRSAAYAEMQRIIKEEDPPAPSVRLSRGLATLAATAAARQAEPANLGVLVKGDLDWIVMKALDKDRARRYESPSQLAVDVQRHLSGEPVAAAPPTAVYRMRKFVRRHKGRVVAVSTLAAVLVLGTITTSIGLVREAKQRRTAEDAQIAEREQREAAQLASTQAEASRLAEAEARKAADAQRETAEQSAYVANLFAAASDSYTARERLDACPEYLRGWEWRYLNAKSDASLYTFRAAPDRQWSAGGFSRDGSQIMLGGNDGAVRIIETATGREVSAGNAGEGFWVEAVAPDAAHILLHTQRRRAIWSIEDERVVAELPEGHGRVRHDALSPDGARVLLASGNEPPQVLDASSGTVLLTLPAYTWETYSADFSADGTRILTTGCDKVGETHMRAADVWDAATGERIVRVEDDALHYATFSPDGSCFATSAWPGPVKLWDAASGELMHLLSDNEPQHVEPVFSPDGRLVYAAPYFGVGRVWEVATGRLVQELIDDEHGVFYGNFSPDGTRIVAGVGPQVCVWDIASGKRLSMLPGHTEHDIGAKFSLDGSLILSRAWDGTARVWDVETTPNPLMISDQGRLCGFTPDGERMLLTDTDSDVRVREASTGKASVEWSHADPKGWGGTPPHPYIEFAALLADGRRVLTVRGSSACVWDAASGGLIREIELPPPTQNPVTEATGYHYPVQCGLDARARRFVTAFGNGSVWVTELADGRRLFDKSGSGSPAAALAPDGRRVALAWDDHTIRVFEVSNGQQVIALQGHSGRITDLWFDPAGTRIVSKAEDLTMRLWDSDSGHQLTGVDITQGPAADWNPSGLGDFDRNGHRVILILDKVAQLRDASTGTLLIELRGHRWWIDRAVFSPDGSRIATASGDRTVRIWEATTGEELLVLRFPTNYDEGFRALAFSPDGARLAAQMGDGELYIFDAIPARGRLGR